MCQIVEKVQHFLDHPSPEKIVEYFEFRENDQPRVKLEVCTLTLRLNSKN